jgi:hypothetical protein
MSGEWYILLADGEEWESLRRLLPLILILLIAAVGAVLRKVKEKAEAEQQRREEQQGPADRSRQEQAPPRAQAPPRREAPPRPPRRPPPTPAEQAVSTLRQLLSGGARAEPPPSAPAGPVAPGRVVRGPAPGPPPRPERLERPLGDRVQRGVHRLEHELEAEEIDRRQRMGALRTLQPTIGAGSAVGREARQARVLVDLGSRREAMRAIIYSEILGLPKALREGPEPWER